MKLNELRDNPGAYAERKRRGRGVGSGLGKTSGSGQKGQKSRSGVALKGFEGGQMPIDRRLPKRGFSKPNRLKFAELNIGRLQQAIDAKKLDAKKALDETALVEAGVVRRRLDGVRLLGTGELKAKLDLTVTGASKGAVEAVEKAGGKLTVLGAKSSKAPKEAAE